MTPIERISQQLAKYSVLKYAVTDSSVTVPRQDENGFEVSFQIDGDRYQVNLGGWHEHFDDVEEALRCFSFGLSTDCRLKITYRGSFPYIWTVQSAENGVWVDDSSTCLLIFPFWKAKKFEFKQNDLAGAESTD